MPRQKDAMLDNFFEETKVLKQNSIWQLAESWYSRENEKKNDHHIV